MNPSNPGFTTLDDWIAREAASCSLDAPEEFNAAVDQLIAALGDGVELLGLGEALHGGEAILLLRNRLFQRLAERHGYTAIAIESSWARSRLVNEYVGGVGAATIRPTAYEAVQEAGFSHACGRLTANRELVELLRTYNADEARSTKLRFYGFDSSTEMGGAESPRRPLTFALGYLDSMADAAGRRHRARIEALLGADADWENPAAAFDAAKSIGQSPQATTLRAAVEDLIGELRLYRAAAATPDAADRWSEAMHYATSARDLLNYHAEMALASDDRTARLLGMRDAQMADNLAYIAACERGRGKVLVFAHNAHLQRSPAQWQWGPNLLVWQPAGAHLHTLFGARYAVVGSGVGVSDENGIGEPEDGTLEARLTAFSAASSSAPNSAATFIPTHRGRGLPPAEIAALPIRTGSARNPGYFPLKPQSLTDFDAICLVSSTPYSRGATPLP